MHTKQAMKKPSKKMVEKITVNKVSTYPAGNEPNKKKERVKTTLSPGMKVQIKNASQKPKRKDSRQVKIERLGTEINLLVAERSSFNSIIGGLRSENNDLKDKNRELEEALGEGLKNLFKKIDEVYSREINKLRKWVWILAVVLFISGVSHIIVGFYNM